jgi:hypothetical protein
MAILIHAHRSARPETGSYLESSDGPTYVLIPPSGALPDWVSPTSYQHARAASVIQGRPASMLQPFTFNDDTDAHVRVVHFRPVDESEDSW